MPAAEPRKIVIVGGGAAGFAAAEMLRRQRYDGSIVMVSDDAARTLLFDLDTAIQRLTRTGADADAVLQLTGCYHNLLRRWARP